MTEENKPSEQELKQPQPDDTGKEKSEIAELRKELDELKKENKRIRREELETRTDPGYIKRAQEDRRKQREARILNQQLPRGKRLTAEQMENMSNADIIAYMEQKDAELARYIQENKINPLVEQTQEESLQAGLRELNKIDKDWVELQPHMLPIARANPDLSPLQVYTAALASAEQWDRLDDVRQKMRAGKESKKEVSDMPKEKTENKPKDVSTGGKPQVAGGEKPSTSVTGIKPPSKPMTAKEAATKAYEEVFEKQGL
jgi:hypothetical protein